MRWTLTVWTYCWEVRTYVHMVFFMFYVLYFLYYVYVCGACTYRAQACAVAYITNVYVFLSVDCLFICPVISMMPFHFRCVCLYIWQSDFVVCMFVCLYCFLMAWIVTVTVTEQQFITSLLNSSQFSFIYVSYFFSVWSSVTFGSKICFFYLFRSCPILERR